MPDTKAPLLLICYSFPPHPGIGGRRWAKFTKYLAMNDQSTIVFNASNIFNENSLWTRDTINDKIQLNSYPFSLQKIVKFPQTVFEKTGRKAINFFLLLTKYNTDLITSLPNHEFWNSIEEKIKTNKIEKVIVSGDPYLFYYASLLKKKVSFELILDYRDLWNDHSFYNNNVSFSKKQRNFFNYCENEALQICDKIIFVDQHLKDTITKRIRNRNPKTSVIPNGLDLDDIKDIKKTDVKPSEKKMIFFWGSISSDLNDSVYHFISSFSELRIKEPGIYNSFHITIGGTIDHELMKKIKSLNLENVTIETKLLSRNEYYERLMNADIGITLNSYEYRNSFVTKFSDYLFLNKFILNISFEGRFAQFIKEHHLGDTFYKKDDHRFFLDLKNNLASYKKPTEEILSSFELKNLTQQLESFIFS